MLKKTKIINSIFVLGFLFFSPATLLLESSAEIWEKSFWLDPSRPIFFSFRDVDGDLSITTHEEPVIKIKVKKEALTKDKTLAYRLLAGTKIEANQRDNRLEVEIIYPRLRTFLIPFRDYRRVKVMTEVSLPQGTTLKANLVDGRVNLRGKLQQAIVTTVDGSIWLEEASGQFNLKTVDGQITIRRGQGQAEITTVDGDVFIEGEIEPIKIKTTDGDIQIDLFPGTGITQPWYLQTIDGDIKMALPSNLSANLALQTIDGSIRCDLALTLSEIKGKKRIEGRLNQGGPLISLQSVDGDLWIQEKSMEKTQK